MRLASLTWSSDMALLLQAARKEDIEIKAWSAIELNEGNARDCIKSLQEAEAILLHPSHQDKLFDQVVESIDQRIPVISFGFDPALWSFSNVRAEIVSTVNAYVLYGGEDNIRSMLRYIGREVLGRGLVAT